MCTFCKGAGNTLYGHCFLLHHKARDRLLALVRLQEFLPTMNSRSGSGEEWVSNIRNTELFEPGVICVITARPLHGVLKRVLDRFVVSPVAHARTRARTQAWDKRRQRFASGVPSVVVMVLLLAAGGLVARPAVLFTSSFAAVAVVWVVCCFVCFALS